MKKTGMETFDQVESNIRSYCRKFPAVFTKAQNAILEDTEGRRYLDFFSGASTLNYGHNNPHFKSKLIDYINADGITHSLDMATEAKRHFLETFDSVILQPRKLSYKIQFTGPTGTNAVEAALKLARKVTSRNTVISFTNAFHGMSLGSLAATGNRHYRQAAAPGSLTDVSFMPYDGYFGPGVDTLGYMDRMLTDTGSGLDQPAAVLVETIQCEGGINVAGREWLQRLADLCSRHDMLLIVDDIQAGCGRTGRFFSFEDAQITPDIVTLSKSLSGFGLPMSIVLIRPELDQWQPGEHTGTFRGNNLAFVGATAAIDQYWRDGRFADEIRKKGRHMRSRLVGMAERYPAMEFAVRGRGMIQALDLADGGLAETVRAKAFERGVVIETSGARDQVIKCIPPLTISDEELEAGLNILRDCLNEAIANSSYKVEPAISYAEVDENVDVA